jgi:hypothetical protein
MCEFIVKVSNKMALNSKTNTTSVSVDDVVLNGILEVLSKSNSKVWSGTMTELNSALVRVLGRKRSEVLPGSPGALRTVTNRVVNRLRNRKISVKFVRTTDHTRTRLVRFAR